MVQPTHERVLRVVETPVQRHLDAEVPIEGPVLLGRAPGPAGVPVVDPRVSTVHLTVYPDARGVPWFRDMGSTNGTFHNGHRAVGGRLEAGDVLRLGATLLVVATRPADLPPPGDPEAIVRAPAARRARLAARAAARTQAPVAIVGEADAGQAELAELVHATRGAAGHPVTIDAAGLSAEEAARRLLGATFDDDATLVVDRVSTRDLAHLAGPLAALAERLAGGAGGPKLVVTVHDAHPDHPDVSALIADIGATRVDAPPLRALREDILAMARARSGRGPAEAGLRDALFEPDLAEVLVLYDWPHNLAELARAVRWFAEGPPPPYRLDRVPKKVVEAAVRPAPSGLADAPEADTRTAPLKVALPRRRGTRPDRDELLRALEEHGYNISAVARAYGRARKQIYRWLEHYDLSPHEP